MKIRRVVIVGRPNVGKSTLFNRLTGRRRALVHDEPGVTRDWTSAPIDLGEGREAELVDTGGLDLADDHPLSQAARKVAIRELHRADVLLFLTDGSSGPTAGDFEVADLVRPLGRPTLLVVNKCDTKKANENLAEFFDLGFGEPYGVSAEHGTGSGALRAAILDRVPEGGGSDRAPAEAPRLAVVGRPNVGKSSLVNRLLGSDRMIVSDLAGTTRDSVDSLIQVQGKPYVLVDTAGLRPRTRSSGNPDVLAVKLAHKSLERADVALLVLDASVGPTSKDAAIGGAIVEARRPAVILANKWDLRGGKEKDAEAFLAEKARVLPMLDFAEVILVSAVTGRRTGDIFKGVDRALAAADHRVSTGELNRLLTRILSRGPRLEVGKSDAKLRYAAQVGVRPPTFVLFTNRRGALSEPMARFLENRLREELPFRGTPLVFRSAGLGGSRSR